MESESSTSYEAPTVTLIGSLHNLTLESLPIGKDYAAHSDGFTFQGKPINVS